MKKYTTVFDVDAVEEPLREQHKRLYYVLKVKSYELKKQIPHEVCDIHKDRSSSTCNIICRGINRAAVVPEQLCCVNCCYLGKTGCLVIMGNPACNLWYCDEAKEVFSRIAPELYHKVTLLYNTINSCRIALPRRNREETFNMLMEELCGNKGFNKMLPCFRALIRNHPTTVCYMGYEE